MESEPLNPKSFQVVAIDGPAASGKSTVSRQLAKKLGFVYVNSGEMYRAVTWAVLQAGVDLLDEAAIWECVRKLNIECAVATNTSGERISTVRINHEDPGDALRSTGVNAGVSQVASVPQVRKLLVKRQRDYAHIADIIMEGRDIGSVVFADSPFKFFVTASEEVRESRRQAEGQTDRIAERDKQDSTRKTSPMVVADDAVQIDTSTKTVEEVLTQIESGLLANGLTPAIAT